jgi:hypothetical protein
MSWLENIAAIVSSPPVEELAQGLFQIVRNEEGTALQQMERRHLAMTTHQTHLAERGNPRVDGIGKHQWRTATTAMPLASKGREL